MIVYKTVKTTIYHQVEEVTELKGLLCIVSGRGQRKHRWLTALLGLSVVSLPHGFVSVVIHVRLGVIIFCSCKEFCPCLVAALYLSVMSDGVGYRSFKFISWLWCGVGSDSDVYSIVVMDPEVSVSHLADVAVAV